jgi:hypothetical protein
MGGSSLAPGMFAKILARQDGFARVRVLDSTHPVAVQRLLGELNLDKTLFLVSTKSGTTTETLTLFRYFYHHACVRSGESAAGRQFVAITDPGSPLVVVAQAHRFRHVFLNDSNLGGRYSALSLVGLVPAALFGADLESLLASAHELSERCSPDAAPGENPAVQLGCFLGAWALQGRDKVTFHLPERIQSFGDWVEQLIAESSGKNQKAILPVVERIAGQPSSYSADRLFVEVDSEDLDRHLPPPWMSNDGHPTIHLTMRPTEDLFAQCLLWEHAVAIACHVMGVHPFNQPNVESTKGWTRQLIDELDRTGTLPTLSRIGLTPQSLASFLSNLSSGDYIALQAYLPESDELTASLVSLQAALRNRTGTATTVGYGPRFLHSTGQLHKGDRGNGRFVQLVSNAMPEIPVPDAPGSSPPRLSFGALITSQALGDRRALEEAGRAVQTFSVADPVEASLRDVARALDPV